jgi:hypothetical protein
MNSARRKSAVAVGCEARNFRFTTWTLKVPDRVASYLQLGVTRVREPGRMPDDEPANADGGRTEADRRLRRVSLRSLRCAM